MVCLLIICSLVSVKVQERYEAPQIRKTHHILNYHLLGNTDYGMYEDADNIDEPFQEYPTLPDMKEHF